MFRSPKRSEITDGRNRRALAADPASSDLAAALLPLLPLLPPRLLMPLANGLAAVHSARTTAVLPLRLTIYIEYILPTSREAVNIQHICNI